MKHDKERGAAGVLVAVMMLVLIGAGALAVDTGQIYAERAQLQNAADAGAIAAAQQCNRAGGCTVAQAKLWAEELTGANSNDGATTVDSVDLSVPRQVKVVTSTRSGANGFLTKMFASALNAPPVTVRAAATASMDPPSGGSAIPSGDLESLLQPLRGESYRRRPKDRLQARRNLHWSVRDTDPGRVGLAGSELACVATTQTGDNDMGSDPGNNPPSGCSTILDGWKATILAGGAVKRSIPDLRQCH